MSLVDNTAPPVSTLDSMASMKKRLPHMSDAAILIGVANGGYFSSNTALPVVPASLFQRVFKSTPEMRDEFVKFLQTIFYRLDEKKVLAEMDKLLSDPTKTDKEIYEHLQQNLGSLSKNFGFLRQLWSLLVLKSGMGKQAKELMQGFSKKAFNDYLEIYDRRYVKTLRQHVGVPLQGAVVAASDTASVGIGDRLQAGALLSKFPYKQHVPLNDADCKDPLKEVEKTSKPIGEGDVSSESIDLIGCLGGLHHVPSERVDAFAASMSRVLRPGGVLLFRDHDAAGGTDVCAIASMVHTFVNIAGGVSWEVEQAEVRNFHAMAYWQELLARNGFTRISNKGLVLQDDPTANKMAIFVKTPQTVDDLKTAMRYRAEQGKRPAQGTRATWLEWGNVRSSKEYAAFIQNRHAYEFDYMGHLRQHWQHFYHYVRENLKDPNVGFKDLLFSGDMLMNLFILTTATVQLGLSAAASAPAKWIYGTDIRKVANLTAYERYEADVEMQYSYFIDHTPFYQFPYLSKIGGLWKAAWQQEQKLTTKIGSSFSALAGTVAFIAKAAISWPIRKIYTSSAALEPDRVSMIVKDPFGNLDKITNQHKTIEVLHRTPDGHALLMVPRYRPFTQICKAMADQEIDFVEIGGQTNITLDLLQSKDSTLQMHKRKDTHQLRVEKRQGLIHVTNQNVIREVYQMDFLLRSDNLVHITFQVAVEGLSQSLRRVQPYELVYIHE